MTALMCIRKCTINIKLRKYSMYVPNVDPSFLGDEASTYLACLHIDSIALCANLHNFFLCSVETELGNKEVVSIPTCMSCSQPNFSCAQSIALLKICKLIALSA